ncbi:MAG: stimulus-sensing domain-containing protein [Proteobacteria bacterium]|nr:stimulus-sensing domain-containing protein [Pseudomonadota bacterium]
MERALDQPTDRLAGHAERRHGRFFGSVTARILAINILALFILAAGLLYLNQHQRGLFAAKIETLMAQAEIIAGALGESVIAIDPSDAGLALEPDLALALDSDAPLAIDPDAARALLRRIIVSTGSRARLFDTQGKLIADTEDFAGLGTQVESEELPPPSDSFGRFVMRIYDAIVDRLPPQTDFPSIPEIANEDIAWLPEVLSALAGEGGSALRNIETRGIVVSVAVPVRHFKQVQGGLLLTTGAEEIAQSVHEVRVAILEAFAISLTITILLSLYLARTIARPIRQLARAADQVRAGRGREITIPDFTRRGDEIAELSGALRGMTDALLKRMDAIERFAADVAHEIKNPLTSVRNAVETASRITNEAQKKQLMGIIMDDVERLDRLITDISDASRLDAELSRAVTAPVDLNRMLSTLVDVHQATRKPDGATAALVLEETPSRPNIVAGIEDRLVQVFENVIANAQSFSPPNGTITIRIARDRRYVSIAIEDEGSGIRPEHVGLIFERFYTLRPKGEKFGTHSGLGLSISKQIVEAHRGTIHAENRLGDEEEIRGARIVIRLPLMRRPGAAS